MWILLLKLCFLIHFSSTEIVTTLKDVSITIPKAIRRGDNAILLCHYNLEGDTLYSVKWYKGKREFFRYTPKENPALKVFPVPGIAVDVSALQLLLPQFAFVHPHSAQVFHVVVLVTFCRPEISVATSDLPEKIPLYLLKAFRLIGLNRAENGNTLWKQFVCTNVCMCRWNLFILSHDLNK